MCSSDLQPPDIGNSHFVHVPYDSFATNDGHIIIAIITDSLWEKFCELSKLDSLNTAENKVQPGRLKNRELIMQTLAELIKTKSNAYWCDLLQNNGIPCAPVNTFSDVLRDPQILARNMVVEVSHPNGKKVQQVGNPIKLSECDHDDFTPPPLLGQQTDEIMKSLLNYSDANISALKESGAIQ